MSDTVILRKASVADYEGIMRVWREASRAGHPFLSEEDLNAQELATRREHLPRADIMVADRDGAVVGFMAILGDSVVGLFVAPHAQGQGIGRQLVETAQVRSSILKLTVYEANHTARAFYAGLGFRPVGRSERDDEGRPLPVLRLGWEGGRGPCGGRVGRSPVGAFPT